MTKFFSLIFLLFLATYNGLAQQENSVNSELDSLKIISKEKKLTWAQKDSLKLQKQKTRDSLKQVERLVNKQVRIAKREENRLKNRREYDALAPTKAAFYSAILPGLGQAYTGKYWKIPIVYGALGTGIGIALWNRDQLNRVRDVFKDRLRGVINEDLAFLDEEALVRAQRTFRQQQELSILITIGIYALNIIDANVTSHLQQFNISEDLSLAPQINFSPTDNNSNYGLSLKYQF